MPSEPSNEDGSPADDDLMAKLSYRGKGDWKCPHGRSCKIGGVDLDGNMILFERNSTFK